MSKPVQLPVQVTSLATKVDGSIKITLETREFSAADSALLFELRGQEAWAVIAPSEVKEVNVPGEKPDPALGTKTPSQRLRAVIYRYWEQQGKGGDFETYYRNTLEKYINQVKDKLE